MTATRALVTGAGGFVGARLAERLLSMDVQPVLLVRPRSDQWRLDALRSAVEVVEVDLRDASAVRCAVRAAAPEWIFHLAAHGAYSWQEDGRAIVDTNLVGTLNLLESAADAGFDAFITTCG